MVLSREITGEEGSTNKPISGATSISLKVPVEAAGKSIFVEATTTDGKNLKVNRALFSH